MKSTSTHTYTDLVNELEKYVQYYVWQVRNMKVDQRFMVRTDDHLDFKDTHPSTQLKFAIELETNVMRGDRRGGVKRETENEIDLVVVLN